MEKQIKKIINKPQDYWQEIVLSISAVIYAIFFSVASIFKYNNFYTGRFDLGNMTQTVWNTKHGDFFMITNPNGTEEVSRLAFHADFILAFFAPLYFLWEDPRVLLILQSIILAFGGIFVYLIAKEILKHRTLSLVLAICFFLNPAVNYTNLYDFHSVTLATTFLLGAFYFILKKKWTTTVLFLFLAGITKEQVWAVTFFFGLYIAFISRQKALGAVISILSLLTFFILFWYAIPHAAAGQHFAVEFYSDFGDSPGDIIKSVITNPIKTIETLLLPDRVGYLRQLFIPLGYLSLIFFPFLIFASPDLFINLLSGSPQMHQIYYQYSATVTPFIFIGAIYGIRLLNKHIPEISNSIIGIFLLILTLTSAYNYGPLPFAKKPNDAWYKKPVPNKEIINNYLNSIPKDVKLSASNDLASHLSHRKYIYVMPVGVEQADLTLHLMHNSNDQERKNFEDMKNNPDFTLIFKDDDFYVFKRINP